MKHPITPAFLLTIFSAVSLADLLPPPAHASNTTQSSQATAPATQTATQAPAPNPSPAPVATDPATPDTVTPAPSPVKKTKKVWTNEEVSGMQGPISVVGDGKTPKSKNPVQTPADPAYVSSVRTQLEKLKNQMASADKELATLKNFSEGEPVATADREFHKSYNNEPIAEQVTNLQIKKKDLQSKIDALLDEARKKGVEPGQLR